MCSRKVRWVLRRGQNNRRWPKTPGTRGPNLWTAKKNKIGHVHMSQHTWSPRLELDGTPILWNTSVRGFQKGQARYIAEALEQPLLLPKDMDAYRRFKQNELFLSLKRDLAMVSDL